MSAMAIHVRARGLTKVVADQLREVLGAFPGPSRVYLHLIGDDGTGPVVQLGPWWKVTDCPELWASLWSYPSLADIMIAPEERQP